MKKLFTLLPIIGLVIGTVAIATEIHKPTPLEMKDLLSVPVCKTLSSDTLSVSTETPVLCAQ